MTRFLALCGSKRKNSLNKKLLIDIEQNLSDEHTFEIYDEIYDFPLFHSGIEYEDYPKIIKEYIAKLDKSDHIVMAIPEYIRGVPATLKNAIEWLLASNILYKKPVSFKVSSARGDACYDNLITFLKFLNPKLHEDGMLLLSVGKRLRDENGQFFYTETNNKLQNFVQHLEQN